MSRRKEEDISRIVHQTSSVNSAPNTKTSLADDKALLSIIAQNNALLAELSASIGQMKKVESSTVKLCPETNTAVFTNQPSVAAFSDSTGRNPSSTSGVMSEIQQLREQLSAMTSMIQNLDRQADARFRGLLRQNQSAPRNDIPRERTRTGVPRCFCCNATGHLSSNCPERRNPGSRAQNQPRAFGPGYSTDPHLNQPREIYRNNQQQNRRDHRLAFLDEGLYDEDVCGHLQPSSTNQTHFGRRSQPHIQQQQQVENNVIYAVKPLITKNRFQKMRSANLHEKLTPQCEQASFSGSDQICCQFPQPATKSRPVASCNQVTVQPITEQLQGGLGSLNMKRPCYDPAQVFYVTPDVEHKFPRKEFRLAQSFSAVPVDPGNEDHSPQTPIALSEQGHNPEEMKAGTTEDAELKVFLAGPSTSNFSTQVVCEEPSKYHFAQEFSVPSMPSEDPVKESPHIAKNDLDTDARKAVQFVLNPSARETPPYQAISVVDLAQGPFVKKGLTVSRERLPVHGNIIEFDSNQLNSGRNKSLIDPLSAKVTSSPQNVQKSAPHASSNLQTSDLTTQVEIAGQTLHFLVDTGACLSAIDEQFSKKTYGPFPPEITNGVLPSVQSVSGDRVPILGKIHLPLKLNGSTYLCDFHIMRNLAYTAILGPDFLQENQALIDLENHSITFKGTAAV